MHGVHNIKFTDVLKARYDFKDIKDKFCRTNACIKYKDPEVMLHL
jgi:hypothetical protein